MFSLKLLVNCVRLCQTVSDNVVKSSYFPLHTVGILIYGAIGRVLVQCVGRIHVGCVCSILVECVFQVWEAELRQHGSTKGLKCPEWRSPVAATLLAKSPHNDSLAASSAAATLTVHPHMGASMSAHVSLVAPPTNGSVVVPALPAPPLASLLAQSASVRIAYSARLP